MPDLHAIAESPAHARWVLDHHVGGERYGTRQRCPICETWWPCDLAGIAALAVQADAENARLREQLRIATDQLQAFSDQEQERYPGEMGTFAHDALIQMSVVE